MIDRLYHCNIPNILYTHDIACSCRYVVLLGGQERGEKSSKNSAEGIFSTSKQLCQIFSTNITNDNVGVGRSSLHALGRNSRAYITLPQNVNFCPKNCFVLSIPFGPLFFINMSFSLIFCLK